MSNGRLQVRGREKQSRANLVHQEGGVCARGKLQVLPASRNMRGEHP